MFEVLECRSLGRTAWWETFCRWRFALHFDFHPLALILWPPTTSHTCHLFPLLFASTHTHAFVSGATLKLWPPRQHDSGRRVWSSDDWMCYHLMKSSWHLLFSAGGANRLTFEQRVNPVKSVNPAVLITLNVNTLDSMIVTFRNMSGLSLWNKWNTWNTSAAIKWRTSARKQMTKINPPRWDNHFYKTVIMKTNRTRAPSKQCLLCSFISSIKKKPTCDSKWNKNDRIKEVQTSFFTSKNWAKTCQLNTDPWELFSD